MKDEDHPSSLIPHPSSLIPHPSSFIPHPSSFILHPSSLIPQTPHGPYEYPDGCEVFIVYMGDASHVWEKKDLIEHKNIWKPETEEGKKGVEEHLKKREKDVTAGR